MSEEQKIVRPTECPECGSTELQAFMPSNAFTVFYLTDGEWEVTQSDRGYDDWTDVEYTCSDCDHWWDDENKFTDADLDALCDEADRAAGTD